MRLYLDASALIYVAEGSPERRDFVLAWIDRVEAEPDGVLITSRLSRSECRVKHLRSQNQPALRRIDTILAAGNLRLADVSAEVIEKAAEVRAQSRLKTPDAIHVATALLEEATAFVTGDKDFVTPMLREDYAVEALCLSSIMT